MLLHWMNYESQKLFRTCKYFGLGTLLLLCLNLLLSYAMRKDAYLNALCLSFNVILGFVLVIGTLIIWMVHFYRSLAGREAAVTMTLPMTTGRLLLGKLVPGMVMTLSALLLFDLVMWIQFLIWQKNVLFPVRLFIMAIFPGAHFSDAGVTAVFLLFELYYVLLCILGTAGFILLGSGKAFSSFGVGGPIIIYVIYYFIWQLISFLLLWASGFFAELVKLAPQGNRYRVPLEQLPDIYQQIMLGGIILGVISTLIIFLLGVYRLAKRPYIR